MKRGPKPKPYAQKVIEGFPGKRNEEPPAYADAGPLIKPEWLPKGAAAIWDRLVGRLHGIKSADSDQFADYCMCLHRLQTLEKRVEREGIIVGGTKGKRKNPALQVIREYRLAVQKWAAEFGLTPSAGSRVGSVGTGPAASTPAEPKRSGLLNGQWAN